MDLLTKDEYAAIAADMDFPNTAYIDGAYRPAMSGKTFATRNPATGEVLTDVAACGSEDVDFAVAKAREAFDDGRWSRMHPSERKDILIRFAKLLTRNARELAVMESVDSGKPIYDCETVDIPETIHCIKWHAEAIDKMYDQIAPSSDDHVAMVVREPIGVVGLILPWNFPLLMLAWKIGPALAAGCSVVVKPAEETSLTALRVAELASEAGVPRGVLNVVPGGGADVGEPIGRHLDIDMVSFTGSTKTGKLFLSYSAESNAKEVVLEMGGKNPAIVMEDAENLDRVAQHLVNGAFWNMGENCSATSRLIVHRAVKTELLERIEHHAQHWNVGDPLDPETRVGALVSPAHFKKVSGYLKKAEDVVFGGAAGGGFVAPSLVQLPDNNHVLARDEIFGPVLGVIEVDSFDQAIEIANDTDYGLCASLFTANAKRAIRGARMLRAGTVTVNSYGEGDISTPFGGYKQSGFGGRDNSVHAHDQYTQLKTIWVDLSDDEDEAVS
ncbi:gamma-glutamyl-gamma-aminobutyraldehyde dehydrogenase [Shimia isoporae]|uniref:Gamma-glutamyl-gamma-aminobutyraldehyde dehydrogenase n=1 Tax=Shimia isoporae TaxID=647720 RepID=A0A4R1N479_9RHOB|nr:aldehyde dehydrogenase [Shimia isoporae]TCL01538.1 gamma-glutamyl-gamma-aminobutyraldehyde dehydrogenase [Shimia isoporae]